MENPDGYNEVYMQIMNHENELKERTENNEKN